MKQYIEAGEFVNTHGVLGELKLYPSTDDAAFVCKLKRLYMKADGTGEVRIAAAREHKGMCLLALEGVASVEDARRYIGKRAYFARADAKLKKGQYFIVDVIGCTVQDADTGKVYGTIANITHPAAHDIYTITNDAGEEFLFPAVPEFMAALKPEEGLVLVRPIAGMFGDAEGVAEDAH